MYKLFLTIRYLRKRRIAFFAVISVWLCVAMEVIVISVMGGFLDTLKERSRGLLSDVVIDNQTLQGFPFYDEFTQHLKKTQPNLVRSATPVIYNYGIIRIAETSFTKPVRIVGIRLREYIDVNDFGNSLFYDKYYPGTTTLKPHRMPVAGFDENQQPLLPDPYESAWQKWLKTAATPDEAQRWQRSPNMPILGPGVYEQNFDGPPMLVGDEAPGVIVGTSIINERRRDGSYERVYPRGAKTILAVIPLTRSGKLSGSGSTTVVARLTDDSRTRVFEIDDMCCYVDFDLAQTWLKMSSQELESGGMTPARTSQLLVRLVDGTDILEGRRIIEDEWERFRASLDVLPDSIDAQLLSFVNVETWEERQVQFIAAVEKEKILVTLLFAIISLVAVVLIGCIFWMIVTQKTRDIGILKSVGASARGVTSIFVMFGGAVGILGALLGSVSGTIFVWYINDIQDLLVAIHPKLRVWSPDVYTFDEIPNVVKVHEVAVISSIAIIASMLGALIPAILAGRVWPVRRCDMSDGQFLLRAKNVHKSYLMGKVTLSVLRGASMNIRPGELLVVMGASGSGKSTLLHVIGALDNPDSGNVSFEGLDVFSQSAAFRESLRCHTIGFVFQFYHLLPELTVLENTLIPKMVKCPTINWRSERSRAREAALAILDDVGLSHRIGHRPNELSGGERQRVAIARALVNQPKLLLADEPTGNLDKKSGGGILELLARFNERGQTIVVVTHDPDTAACAHRRVLLEDGQIRPT